MRRRCVRLMDKWIEKWIKVYLKCYINLILFHRNVYPATTFDITTFQGFNLPQFLPINRHPDLQGYIEELIEDLISKLSHVYRLSICILDTSYDVCIEKFVLDFGEFQHKEGKPSTLGEIEVFDEFRSSLNSLIARLERMRKIKDDSVTFEITINTVHMELGHNGGKDWVIDKREELNEFDRDTNWTRTTNDEKVPLSNNLNNPLEYSGVFEKPKIRMSPLVGCDLAPLIIHAYLETLILNPKNGSSLAYVDSIDESML